MSQLDLISTSRSFSSEYSELKSLKNLIMSDSDYAVGPDVAKPILAALKPLSAVAPMDAWLAFSISNEEEPALAKSA